MPLDPFNLVSAHHDDIICMIASEVPEPDWLYKPMTFENTSSLVLVSRLTSLWQAAARLSIMDCAQLNLEPEAVKKFYHRWTFQKCETSGHVNVRLRVNRRRVIPTPRSITNSPAADFHAKFGPLDHEDKDALAAAVYLLSNEYVREPIRLTGYPTCPLGNCVAFEDGGQILLM